MIQVTPLELASAQPTRLPDDLWSAAAVFLLGTWLGAGALMLLQPALGLSPDLLVLAQLGPSLGVLAVVQLRRRRGQLTMLAATVRPTAVVLRRVVAGTGLVGVVLAISVSALAVTGHPVTVRSPGQLVRPLWVLAPLQLVGACGEELGWRAFLQQHLQTRWSMTGAALAVGTLWAGWHVEYYRCGPLFLSAFWLSCLAMSLILAHLVMGAGRGALLIAGTVHCVLNLGTLMVLDFSGGDVQGMLVLAGATTVVAGALVASARLRTTSR